MQYLIVVAISSSEIYIRHIRMRLAQHQNTYITSYIRLAWSLQWGLTTVVQESFGCCIHCVIWLLHTALSTLWLQNTGNVSNSDCTASIRHSISKSLLWRTCTFCFCLIFLPCFGNICIQEVRRFRFVKQGLDAAAQKSLLAWAVSAAIDAAYVDMQCC